MSGRFFRSKSTSWLNMNRGNGMPVMLSYSIVMEKGCLGSLRHHGGGLRILVRGRSFLRKRHHRKENSKDEPKRHEVRLLVMHRLRNKRLTCRQTLDQSGRQLVRFSVSNRRT